MLIWIFYVNFFMIIQIKSKSNKEDFDSSVMKRLKSPKDGEERIMLNYYNRLKIPIESQSMDLHYWQYFSSPWAANIEFETRHQELTRYEY